MYKQDEYETLPRCRLLRHAGENINIHINGGLTYGDDT